MLKQFYVAVQKGAYSLGVDTKEEAMLAAYGDYSCIDGVGYPSVVGDFFESHSGESTWSANYVTFEPDEVEETIELMEALIALDVQVLHVNEGDVTHMFKQLIETALREAKQWKERYDA